MAGKAEILAGLRTIFESFLCGPETAAQIVLVGLRGHYKLLPAAGMYCTAGLDPAPSSGMFVVREGATYRLLVEHCMLLYINTVKD
jgi:hypothetical protein